MLLPTSQGTINFIYCLQNVEPLGLWQSVAFRLHCGFNFAGVLLLISIFVKFFTFFLPLSGNCVEYVYLCIVDSLRVFKNRMLKKSLGLRRRK